MNLRLAHELQRRGWRVKVAALFDRWRTVGDDLCQGLDIVILGGPRVWEKFKLPLKLAGLAKQTEVVLGGAECAATSYGFVGAKLAGRPFIGWHHTAFHRNRHDLGALDGQAIISIHRRLKWIVFPSEGARESLRNTLGGQPEDAVWQVIENFQPLRHHFFPPNPPNAAIFSKPVVMGIGRLAEEKAFDRLIRAHAALRAQGLNHHLVILGDGPLRPRLETEIERLGVQETAFLPGYVSNVQDWLAHATVFALCSLYEGFALVLIEALSCGVPAVAMDCPSGPGEILENGRWGRLVPDGDEKAFTQAIGDLLQHSEQRAHFAALGRQRAKDYAPERIVPKWEALLEEVAGS